MEITQIKDGSQPRPYADHVWEWDIITDKPREEVLEFCRRNFEHADRDEAEYFRLYRDSTLSFDEIMRVVCGGYYNIFKIEGGWKYRVTHEYID